MSKHHILIEDCARERVLATSNGQLTSYDKSDFCHFEDEAPAAKRLIHGTCRLGSLRYEAERVYPEIGNSILPSLTIFEVRDGYDGKDIPSFKWVRQHEADTIEVNPRIDEIIH